MSGTVVPADAAPVWIWSEPCRDINTELSGTLLVWTGFYFFRVSRYGGCFSLSDYVNGSFGNTTTAVGVFSTEKGNGCGPERLEGLEDLPGVYFCTRRGGSNPLLFSPTVCTCLIRSLLIHLWADITKSLAIFIFFIHVDAELVIFC